MFVTFYSYKGGVGRTLAVANVAYLLATGREQPCRVLLWDYDLEAPGLPHLLRCRWRESKQGFVDLVARYLGNAELPPVGDYIHPTAVAGIDLLPAGYIDRHYSAKLEGINWRTIYQKARGYDFIEAIKTSITAIDPPYDYVLIDSRTGYSDVGGICLHQLPDIVVLMFRLNFQNLDGTRKVLNAIKAFSRKNKRRFDVVPVASPVWPFGTVEANEQIRKAKAIFKERELLEISFDPNLTFHERVIVTEEAKYEVKPRVVSDYEQLATAVRGLNPRDPVTLHRLTRRSLASLQYDSAFEYASTLVHSWPKNSAYWRAWVQSVRGGKLEDRAASFLQTYIGNHPAAANAYLAQAQLNVRRKKVQMALEDLRIAISCDPELAPAYFERGTLLLKERAFAEAIKDFDKYIEHSHDANGYVLRGSCQRELGRFDDAAADFKTALEMNPKESSIYTYLGNAYFGKGELQAARAQFEQALGLTPRLRAAEIWLTHTLARLGEVKDARVLLEKISLKPPNDIGDALNRAEAYLALGDLGAARELLSVLSPRSAGYRTYEPIKDLLMYCVTVLEGNPDNQLGAQVRQVAETKPSVFQEIGWSFMELRRYLLAPCEGFEIGQVERDTLLSLLQTCESATKATRLDLLLQSAGIGVEGSQT